VRREFVLDASVTVAWSMEDEKDYYSLKALDSLCEGVAWVPRIWPLEVANALLWLKGGNGSYGLRWKTF